MERKTTEYISQANPRPINIELLGSIATSLIRQDPKSNSCEFLWEYNCAVYSTAVAWKEYTEKKPNERKVIKKPKWLREIEAKMINIRKTKTNESGPMES